MIITLAITIILYAIIMVAVVDTVRTSNHDNSVTLAVAYGVGATVWIVLSVYFVFRLF